MKRTTIAIDLAKSVFEVAVSDRPGRVAERHRLSRSRLLPFLAAKSPATVLLEACGSSHYWAREIQRFDHRVLLLPPHITRKYVHRDKTDRSDAKALLEAYRNKEIRPVPVKSVPQQALASLHRLRSAWLSARTARLNTLRGLLREFGLTIPVGARNVLPRLTLLLGDAEAPLPDLMRPALAETVQEIRDLEQRIRKIELQLRSLASQIPTAARLETVPGIGLLTATALVAMVGDIRRFPSARHFASYIGLTPKEHSSGSRRRLGAISKRGDIYMRMLLIHGARATLNAAKSHPQPDRLRAWALQIQRLRGHNRAAVALANKMARVAWAVWRNDTDYHGSKAA